MARDVDHPGAGRCRTDSSRSTPGRGSAPRSHRTKPDEICWLGSGRQPVPRMSVAGRPPQVRRHHRVAGANQPALPADPRARPPGCVERRDIPRLATLHRTADDHRRRPVTTAGRAPTEPPTPQRAATGGERRLPTPTRPRSQPIPMDPPTGGSPRSTPSHLHDLHRGRPRPSPDPATTRSFELNNADSTAVST